MDELCEHIRQRARSAGVNLDTYDPDFILGVIIGWLGDHDAILTASGLEKN